MVMGNSASPTLFFDRSVGKRLPETLISLQVPIGIGYHQQHFAHDEKDDLWLPDVGNKGWTVIGQDWSYHKNIAEISAIKQYGIGVFYLWGAEARLWEQMFCFARAYNRIVEAIQTTPRPFIYWVNEAGRLRSEPIP